MKRRERIENKIAKREEWAEGRTQKAEALRASTPDSIRHDWAFITQPGPIPERARMIKRDDKAHEHSQMAIRHASKADGLQRQLDTSIFSDDDNAIEELEKRIEANETRRKRMRDANRLYRKGDAEGLAKLGFDLEKLKVEIATRYTWEQKGPYRPYELSNLGGRITADKKRLVVVRAQQERSASANQQDDGVFIETGDGLGDYCRITFSEKPERSVLTALKAAGFRWGGGAWTGKADQIPAEVSA